MTLEEFIIRAEGSPDEQDELMTTVYEVAKTIHHDEMAQLLIDIRRCGGLLEEGIKDTTHSSTDKGIASTILAIGFLYTHRETIKKIMTLSKFRNADL